MTKTLTLICEDNRTYTLNNREIIEMELKINLLNWDGKYDNIAKQCYDLYYDKLVDNLEIKITSKEFDYVVSLGKRSYQELYDEKYAIVI